jgi:hypothetical protein
MEMIVNSPKYGEFKVLIDDEDFEKYSKIRWQARNNHGSNVFYIASYVNIDGTKKRKNVELGRYLLNAEDGQIVDHINRDTLDNRKENLRICTIAQNSRNSKKRKDNFTSNYKGVYWKSQHRKYCAQINFNRKKIHLGYFETEDQAAIAYNIAAVKYFGEFARPNDNIMMHKGFH